MRTALILAATLGAGAHAVAAAAETQPAPATQPAPIRVMSFNLRNAAAPDGDNAWTHRTELVADAIRGFDPDLLGAQEALGVQREWLQDQFQGYGYFGVSRNDGRDGGEGVPLLFRRDRFDVLAAGHFWLSERPDEPGSVGWDAALPRIATWARLRDRATGAAFVFANAHLDHRGRQSRERSAGLIRAQLARFADGAPVLIVGDFNAAPGDPPHRALLAGGWLDTFRAAHPTTGATTRPEGEGTFHGFTGRAGAARIDWIVASPQWTVDSAHIERFARDGRYPSDHFAVTAVLRLPPTSRPEGQR